MTIEKWFKPDLKIPLALKTIGKGKNTKKLLSMSNLTFTHDAFHSSLRVMCFDNDYMIPVALKEYNAEYC